MNTPSTLDISEPEKQKKHIVTDIDALDLSTQKVLTGMRPSGKLHLWHYFGALTNWITLQNKVKCQFLVADYHVLGERTEDIERLKENVMDVVMDWLSVWIDPEKSDFVVQSYVPEWADLAQYFSMITPYSRLAQNPTLKNEMKQLEESWQNEALSLGFFGYPVSQASDILLPRANLVPVWADQIPHIELARYIARTFNRKFGNVFEEPRALLSPVSRLVGIDGNDKMSKSLWNTIMLSDSADRVKEQVMKMYTDPNHFRVSDPWKIEWNVVFTYLDIFESNKEILADMKYQYQKWGLGDVTIKKHLIQLMNDFLQPIRERRAYYETRPDIARDAIEAGSARARKIAQETIEVVKSKIGIQRY